MRDSTVSRAVNQGARTVPVESRPRTVRPDVPVPAEDVALVLEWARQDRLEAQIREYAWKKRNQ